MAVELISASRGAAPKKVAEEAPAPEPEPSYAPTSEYAEPVAAAEPAFSGAETIENYQPVAAEPEVDSESFGEAVPVEEEESAGVFDAQPVEPVEEVWTTPSDPEPAPAAQPRRRYGQDAELPVEVHGDEERRLHNDARRFARLLISEIKLYNEQKVAEGRTEHDLYDRLREYIDRSREMYDKRVKAEVAARYDYFHGELVNTLAEGDASKLGSNYPGATVNA
jgi:hypothetical protein